MLNLVILDTDEWYKLSIAIRDDVLREKIPQGHGLTAILIIDWAYCLLAVFMFMNNC